MANGQYANGNNEQYGEVPEAGGGGELPAGTLWVQLPSATESILISFPATCLSLATVRKDLSCYQR